MNGVAGNVRQERRAWVRKMRIVVVLLAVLAAPLATASATEIGTARCDVVLPLWPTVLGNAGCAGEATGVFAPEVPVCVPRCDFQANFQYADSCVTSEPPLVGAAIGTFSIQGLGRYTADFSATRVGSALAIVYEGDRVATGEFIPSPPLPTCASPGQLFARVVVHFQDPRP